ncbi:MAG: glycosyltransferase family 2 protein, partial [Pseudomonas sp.]
MPRSASKTMPKQLRLISFVIPVHNEAQNAPLLYHEILKNVKALPYKFEFIYVDDGSSDFSSEAIEELAKAHQNIRLIQLSRNFGKEAAVSAGLHAARGDAAMILDADFQHPPTLIGDFVKKWQADGKDVIIGIRK